MPESAGIIEVIKNRRNTKKFTDEIVSDENVELILECATWAPNHRNTEPWRFYVSKTGSGFRDALLTAMIEDQEMRSGKEVTDVQRNNFHSQINQSPILIFVYSEIAEIDAISEENYAAVCCAIQNMQLAAESIGLGIGWSTGKMSKIPQLEQILGIEEKLKMVGVLSVGYPDAIVSKDRKHFQDLTKWV